MALPLTPFPEEAGAEGFLRDTGLVTSPFLPGLGKLRFFLHPDSEEEGSGVKVLGTQTGPGLWGRRPWGHLPPPPPPGHGALPTWGCCGPFSVPATPLTS